MGTMFFGTKVDQDMSFRLLDYYVETGGTFLDTANMYHWKVPGFVGGESETLLGRWMKERKNRSQMFVATKVGFEYPGVERGSKAHQ
ncbi:MAG: aldo/keto reductase, partial [Deltaproteobacteria bacterium]|nr:aldo/keto reductase [Deltaproteobacteria bacterium]